MDTNIDGSIHLEYNIFTMKGVFIFDLGRMMAQIDDCCTAIIKIFDLMCAMLKSHERSVVLGMTIILISLWHILKRM